MIDSWNCLLHQCISSLSRILDKAGIGAVSSCHVSTTVAFQNHGPKPVNYEHWEGICPSND